MADTTIVTPANGDSSMAVVVSVILIALLLIGGFVWYQNNGLPKAEEGATNINVTVPNPTTPQQSN